MKYDPDKSFGYPVLTPHSDDYIKSSFQTELDFNINSENPKQFVIEYSFFCGVRELIDFVRQGNAAYWIKENGTKPVVSFIAGATAPKGRTMGHAGAIVSGSSGTAAAKKEALEAVGVRVGKTPSETARLAREILSK